MNGYGLPNYEIEIPTNIKEFDRELIKKLAMYNPIVGNAMSVCRWYDITYEQALIMAVAELVKANHSWQKTAENLLMRSANPSMIVPEGR